MTLVGLVTIGQAPRADIVPSMFPLGLANTPVQAGALDSLTNDTIASLAPMSDEHPLVTRLRDGQEVVVAKQRIVPFLQRAIDRAVADGAAVVVVLCTGEFPSLTAPVPLIFPDRLLRSVVDALLPAGHLGILMPHEGQREMMLAKWQAAGRTISTATASPYSATADLEQQARLLRDRGADLIVMDCMGFSNAMKQVVARAAGRPTILANRLVGRIVEELTEAGEVAN